jgi:hypothetical protein
VFTVFLNKFLERAGSDTTRLRLLREDITQAIGVHCRKCFSFSGSAIDSSTPRGLWNWICAHKVKLPATCQSNAGEYEFILIVLFLIDLLRLLFSEI